LIAQGGRYRDAAGRRAIEIASGDGHYADPKSCVVAPMTGEGGI
jgi:hypothetical protein